MATLKKMTRVGADVRQIARLLQSKAPEGHMLAYITPEEAKLLKSQGGSGKEHEDTGIPSFEVGATGMDMVMISTPLLRLNLLLRVQTCQMFHQHLMRHNLRLLLTLINLLLHLLPLLLLPLLPQVHLFLSKKLISLHYPQQ